MKGKKLTFAFLILGLIILTKAVYSAESEKNTKESRPAAKAESHRIEDSGTDIVLLMDSSGSMQKTDPRNYRRDSARLFISLLGSDDNVGIIGFGDSAKTLMPLTINSANNRPAFIKAISKITSRELTTDITGAVKKGFGELLASKRMNRVLIIMSDGKLDLGDPEKEKASLEELHKLLPEINKAGIKLYSIAFSELSDQTLLADMADKTGGFFRYAEVDKDIHLMFTSIFEKIKSPDSISLDGDSFSIDKDVKEAVLIITKQPGTATMLLAPSGIKIVQGKLAKNIQWYSSSIFDMITLLEPMTGKWKVKLSIGAGNKIFVLTNLNLKSSFSGNVFNKGDKAVIDAWLEKDYNMIADTEVLSQIRFSAEVIYPDGSTRKIPLADKKGAEVGVYAVELNLSQPGDYTVRLVAEGKTFNRTKDILFKAVEPPPVAAVSGPAVQTVTKPTSSAKLEADINWEIIALVLAAISMLLIALIGYLYANLRKYKKLCISRDDSLVLQTHSQRGKTAAESNGEIGRQQQAEVVSEMPVAEVKDTGEVIGELPDVLQGHNEQVCADEVLETKGEGVGPDSNRIEKLLGIIEFQKSKIAEMMLVQDIFANLRARLGSLQDRNHLIHDKVKTIAEVHGISEEMKEHVSAFEDDASELASYVSILEKEEHRLAEKFIQWEEEHRVLMADDQYSSAAPSVNSAVSMIKIAELEEKLIEAQGQIMSKDRRMQALEKQYEDMEKEYMILYHAQQKQQQQKQPDI